MKNKSYKKIVIFFYIFTIFLMKDKIKRSIVITIFGLFLLYLIWLISQWTMIVQNQYAGRNIPMYIILIAICLYMVCLYWIYPIHVKFSRATALVIWLLFIVLSQVVLANDGYSHIYIWDLFSVLGVLILILFPTNILTTDKVKKQKAKKNEVIIEV
jgi:peptidoglycan/LPS O-acetylase OafA/YrhL